MTLPHTAEAKAWAEQMCSGAFQFQVPTNAATVNTQVKPSLLTMATPPTSQLTPTSTVSPVNTRAQIFCTPNGSVAGNAANNVAMPRGITTGAIGPAGSEFLIDLSGFPADIINATANYVINTRGASNLQCAVSCVDNVNKLLYLQVYNQTTGAPAAAVAGALIMCQVVFQDSYAI